MQVQMVDCLAAVISRIGDDAIALIQPLRASKISRGGHQVTKQRLMLCKSLRLRCYMLFGDNQ